MFGRRLAVVAAALAVAASGALASGCQRQDDGRLHVVTSFYPLQFVAQRVVGSTPGVEITNLTRPGQEPHDLELTVRQTAKVVDADVLLVERGLQPAVDDAVDTSEPPRVLDAARVVHLHPQPGRHDQVDPHFWLDPTLLSRVAAAFETELAKSDPAHANEYRRNLRTLQRQLTGLDRSFKRGLAHCRVRTIVVSHDAFGYFGRRYGLQVAPINGLSPDAEPSPAHVRQLQGLIRSDGITTVFTEALASPQLADSLASDLHLRTAVLDPVEGLSKATAHENYLSLMRRNLTALRQAEQCS